MINACRERRLRLHANAGTSELLPHVSNAAQTNAASRRENRDTRARRVLFIADTDHAGESLPAQLARAGYEVRAARTEHATQTLNEFAPHVALIAAQAGARGEASLELAARLRGARATSALPLVLLFDQQDASLRATALRLGADDYFALSTPPAEIAARLDALFWRIAAGRRPAALAALERRAEIDGFLQLLESVRADIDAGLTGTLALIAAAPSHSHPSSETSAGAAGTPTPETRAFAEAHDFFKLNLRRVDAVAFYGPTLLLAYLPQKSRDAAHTDLARLSEEFQATTADASNSFDIGLASFPSDGTEIESLIERAEASLQQTRPPHAAEDAQETSSNARTGSKPASVAAPPPIAPRTARDSKQSPVVPQTPSAERNARAAGELSPSRAVRESKQTDMETSIMPSGGAGGGGGGQGTLAQAAADAAARERERRTRGALMPRRLLLTVSDPARMAQINLLLRSAGYEVRAAFDGLQAINLLRIERPDLLVIDVALYGIDGLEALRRLHRQHQGRLPLPVVLLLPATPATERERVREEAFALGARAFVAVPYDPEELLTCVRTVGSTD
ncbi:MAG TPA: response regulator [Pyrinomonadaceae bacterium]|jgi:DNA-binding response OmpR family regulator|nr:response regulator [Pyrinomonadaceae bacterium]